MKAWGQLAGVAAITLALLAPATAAAKPERFVAPPSFVLQATLPKSNGYAIQVVSSRRRVELIATRGGSFAIYSVTGRASGEGLSADFGRYGRVDVRFESTTEIHPEADSKYCTGKPPVTRRGVLRGTIRFRGEHGFVAVATETATAIVNRSFRNVCVFPDGNNVVSIGVKEPRIGLAAPRPEEDEADVLLAHARSHGRRTFLTAINFHEIDSAIIVAGTDERVGSVRIGRLAQAAHTRGLLTFSPAGAVPVTASAEPRAPFHGKGSYEKQAGKRASWTGSLSVSLPGLGPVPLTGPGFHASVCHTSLVDGFEGCGKPAS